MHRTACCLTRLSRVLWLGGLLSFVAPSGPLYAHEPTSQAIRELTLRLEHSPSATDYLRRGELLRVEQHFDEALADYARAVELDSSLHAVWMCRGALFLDRGEPETALLELDRYLLLEPDHAEGYRLRGRAKSALGRAREAVSDLDRAIELTSRPTPDHYFERARVLAGLGEEGKHEAIASLDRGIVRLGPVVALQSMAIDLEVELGLYDAALARVDKMAPQFGRRETVLERRGQILLAAGRRDEARAAFVAALAELDALPAHRRSTRASKELESNLRAALAELLADQDRDATEEER